MSILAQVQDSAQRQDIQVRNSINRHCSPFFSFNRPETPPDDMEEDILFKKESPIDSTPINQVILKDIDHSASANLIVESPEAKIREFPELNSEKKPDFQFPQKEPAAVSVDFDFNSRSDKKSSVKKTNIWGTEEDDVVMGNFLQTDNLFSKPDSQKEIINKANKLESQVNELQQQI